jgi:predicted transcriptional regulator
MPLTALEENILEILQVERTDYAHPMTSEELGKRLQLNPAYVRERMMSLIKKGLVQVRRGPGGGYYICDRNKGEKAMRVTIDGVEYKELSGTFSDELWEKIRVTVDSQKRLIQQVRVNGELLDESTCIPYKQVELIEVDTICPLALLKETYQSAIDYLPKLIDAIFQIAEYFRSGSDGEAIKLFLQAENGLHWNAQLIQNSSVLLSSQPKALEFHQRNQALLKEVLEAWENEDFVTVADLMEYELAPLLREWLNFIKEYEGQEIQ